MKVKLILPALAESDRPLLRPIKYSLFPPLGLATLAGYFPEDDELQIIDQHIERIDWTDRPDLVLIQVYTTNAYRAYEIADRYRASGSYVLLGGLHVSALPEEAQPHADTIFIGPGEATLPAFLRDYRSGSPAKRYISSERNLDSLPRIRRDLIRQNQYLVPNTIVVSRGCPHHCDFCYKDTFFAGGASFYVRRVDDAIEEIAALPGKHLFFLDDHLFGHYRFAGTLFGAMEGMGRIFQGAATVESIVKTDLVEKAAKAGLRSLFVGFETFSAANLLSANKAQNLQQNYAAAVRKLHDFGIMINGSFVFGMDDDETDVFRRTVDWAVENSLTTATFHILTPYPNTPLFLRLSRENRILTTNWDRYTTRDVVYTPSKLTPEELVQGYGRAYKEFYSWTNIFTSSIHRETGERRIKQFLYTAGWKKFEPFWSMVIQLNRLRTATPALEYILSTLHR